MIKNAAGNKKRNWDNRALEIWDRFWEVICMEKVTYERERGGI